MNTGIQKVWQIALPWPPSMNRYWRFDRGRVHVATEGVKFRSAVIRAVADAKAFKKLPVEPMRFKLALVVDASPPDRRARDLDNLLKATQDALAYAGVYQSDAQIDDVRVLRDEPVKGGRLLITLTEFRGQHKYEGES